MAVTKTMADLESRAREIAHLCHESDQPVFITDGGGENLVVMSRDAYERTEARLDLYRSLDESEDDFRDGDRGISVQAMRERVRG